MIRRRHVLVVSTRPDDLADIVGLLEESGLRVTVARRLDEDVAADLALVDVSDEEHWVTAELLSTGLLILRVAETSRMRRGFELGADDIVLADADPAEIVARCEAVLRRTGQRPDEGDAHVYVDRRIWVNFGSRQVWIGERPAHLTPREFRLLGYLIRNLDRTVTHEDILREVWGRESQGDQPSEVLKQYIWRLRQKIERDPNRPQVIVTDPGHGYRFVSELG